MSASTTITLPAGASRIITSINARSSSQRSVKNDHGGDTNTSHGMSAGNGGSRLAHRSTSPGRTSTRLSSPSDRTERRSTSAVGK